MKYIARQQIIDLFTNPQETMRRGLWFSGYYGEGEYRDWYEDGKLSINCYFKDGKRDGECKMWNSKEEFVYHKLYKDGELVKDYLR